jgi:hypothetical protein
MPAWTESRLDLNRYFALELESHCFAEPAYEWIGLLEPQVTRGFVHFLNEGPSERRLGRCSAFARAAARFTHGSIECLADLQPTGSLARAEESRIDVLVELRGKARVQGVAIEAKFGHTLTKGQLRRAEAYTITERQWSREHSSYLVIAPRRSAQHVKELRANANWREISWWAFMRVLEREIEPASDTSEFRRFRRTVWWQAY